MSKRDWWTKPFERLVVMGESTVEGGDWLPRREDRWADVLADLISSSQGRRIEYYNKGIGANVISPRSPGYPASAPPSGLERYRQDVIALKPDLFVLCYGLNDMRAGMSLDEFREDMQTIVRGVRESCGPLVIVLTTVYHMTAYNGFVGWGMGGVDQTRFYNEVIRGLAEANRCLLADVWQAEATSDWLIHPDGVHANAVGNLVIANRVFEVLAQNCSGLTVEAFRQARETEWTKRTTKMREENGDPFRKTW